MPKDEVQENAKVSAERGTGFEPTPSVERLMRSRIALANGIFQVIVNSGRRLIQGLAPSDLSWPVIMILALV